MNTPALPAPMPAIDVAAIRIYCETVFGYLEGLVPVRYLSEKGTTAKQPRSEFPSVEALVQRLIATAPRAADDQRAVFVVPGTVAKPGSARADDIVQTGVVLVDLDEGDIDAKRAHLARHLGPPALEVASGGTTAAGQVKLHLYWRLKEPAEAADRDRVAQLRALIAAKVGGDPSFDSLHQPVRVAGTIHGKNGIRSAVGILAHSEAEHDLADLEELVAAMPALAGIPSRIDAGTTGCGAPSARILACTRVREGGVDGVTRFQALSMIIGHWLRTARRGDCDLDAAWQAVVDHNAAMISPPWDEQRLRREFDALYNRDAANHAPLLGRLSTEGHSLPAASGSASDLSDDALAEAFVTTEGDQWHHVPVWRTWFHWNGKVWVRDQIGIVRERMRLVCRASAIGHRPEASRCAPRRQREDHLRRFEARRHRHADRNGGYRLGC